MLYTEEWKEVEYSPNYSVSSFGRVRNNKSGKILSDRISCGYKHVLLYKRGITKDFRVHRLVAKAFIPNPDELPEVNHIDGNKINNTVENLEWCTPSQNQLHAYRIGLQVHVHGSGHFAAKISEKDVLLIRKMYKVDKIHQWKIGEKFGINQQNVSLICSGKAWAHVKDVELRG